MGDIGGRAWQRMLSGRRLDILEPSPFDIEIEDIALGLSRVARWNGQTTGEHAYSVAQHSILVTELVAAAMPSAPSSCLLAALLHDAPEYVTSDLVTPFKRVVGDAYKEIETRVGRAIHLAFNLPPVLPDAWRSPIQRADRFAAFIEAMALAGFSEAEAKTVFGVRRNIPAIALKPLESATAREAFLAVFADLVAGGRRCLARWGAADQAAQMTAECGAGATACHPPAAISGASPAMRRYEGTLLLSSGDLVAFLGCRHSSALDYRALDEDLDDADDDPTLKLVQDKGIAHELAFLAKLEAEGRQVVRIPDKVPLPDRLKMTAEAMRAGADVIYQAALLKDAWHGFADFLTRIDEPSDLGSWSYEVADTKLSSGVKARYAVQLSVYSDLVARIQGRQPMRMSLALGDSHTEVLHPDDFIHYVRLAARRLEAFLGDAAARTSTAPEPCAHCEMCRWRERCATEWEAADHLSLVANIRRSQRDKLVAAGVSTVAALATLPAGQKVPGMTADILARLRAQARLQVAVRGTEEHRFELLPPAPGRAFERLPRPAEGDLFFDMEGDPLYRDPSHGDGGLEYLFGVHWGEPAGGTFRGFWAHDREAEKRALEEFLDFTAEHLARHPDAHIYHYNHYEVTAVRRLAMRHATREAMVDDLLRRRKFVDLFKVVREGLLVSEPRYSLKNIEHFYMAKREGEVATAGDSIVAYETWRVTGEQHILDEIESYNAIDCRSTAALQDWLLSVRPTNIPWFEPNSVAPDDAALARQAEAEAERAAIEAALVHGVAEEEKPFRRLVVDLVEFHRREQKPEWWALFDRQGRDTDDLIDDAECLGALRLVGSPVTDKKSLVCTFRFPPQETKLKKGERPVIVDTLEPAGSIEVLDMDRGVITLKRGAGKGPFPPLLNLGPGGPIEDKVLREAIKRFADSIASGSGRFPAVTSILRREPPRLTGWAQGQPLVAAGQDLVQAAIAAVGALQGSHLFIQGPPGTGKTYTSSHVIVEMMKRGKCIGVSSNSHKAINNLLAGIEKAAGEVGFTFRGYKKSTAGNADTEFGGTMVVDVPDAKQIPPGAQLVAGTAWLFARARIRANPRPPVH